MKLAIAYSTKDRVELTKQSIEPLFGTGAYIYWCDGSATPEGVEYFERHKGVIKQKTRVTGGADAAIAFGLSALLNAPENYTHIGLVENDVLLDDDWLEPTLDLFHRGERDGLVVGAVSARSYVDRVLIQRDGYAVMHNIGAGAIIFTRQAAEIVLDSIRSHWAPHIRSTWMRLAGIDIGRYWAFRGNDQWLTSDWGYEAVLASHGLASLALTPAKCQMIGQVPPLAEQGLEMVTDHRDETFVNDKAFYIFRHRTRQIRERNLDINSPATDYDPRIGGERIIFAHQAPRFGATFSGNWRLQWSQGFGPFAYRAGEGGASVSVPVYGSCSFLVSGGDTGSRCKVTDATSGYTHAPNLSGDGVSVVPVPGAVTYREVTLAMDEGGVFYGYNSPEGQPYRPGFKFDYSTLPPV